MVPITVNYLKDTLRSCLVHMPPGWTRDICNRFTYTPLLCIILCAYSEILCWEGFEDHAL